MYRIVYDDIMGIPYMFLVGFFPFFFSVFGFFPKKCCVQMLKTNSNTYDALNAFFCIFALFLGPWHPLYIAAGSR